MMITDRFLLTQSKEFNLRPNEEVRVDLKLKKKPRSPETKITGRVTHDGIPVPKATVKVLDQKFDPVIHALTNQDGIYLIENLMPGDYKLTASAEGFLAADSISFSLQVKEEKTINIQIKEDKASRKNSFIYGTVTEFMTGKIIEDAVIKLFSSASEPPVAETASNESGQYLFCTIPPAKYFAVAGKPGYLTSDPIRFEIAAGQFVKVPFQLRINPLTSTGTVSGIITERVSGALAGVCVGLFSVSDDGETLIQIKTTNREGLYLFPDVQPGEYVVKAKMQDKWDFSRAHRVLVV